MNRAFWLPVLSLLLLPILVGAAASPSPADPPAHRSEGRGPVLDFDIITEQDAYGANVSDPTVPSVSIVVIIKNNGTLPTLLSVRLSVSVNLGGTATVVPAETPFIGYQGQTTAVVSVTLPDDTLTSLIATLRIDGVCVQNSQVTDLKQVQLTIRQWHSIRVQNVSLSSSSPVERELLQISSKVRNLGNGPTYIMVGASLDGKRLDAKVDSSGVDQNTTIKVDAGKFVILTATWKAEYGHHSFLLEAQDIGSPDVNASSSFSSDTRMVPFFVNFNMRDWTPYFFVAGIVSLAAAGVVFRYRKRLAVRFPRFGRALRIKLPPPGPRTARLQQTIGAQVKRARGAAARVGQRPLPKYVARRVRSDIDRIRSRTIPKGPPPGPEEVERMKPPEKRGLR